jgi:hypothetical protein
MSSAAAAATSQCIELSHADPLCVQLKRFDLCADDAAAAIERCVARSSALTHVHLLECASLNADGVAALSPLINSANVRALTLTDADLFSAALVDALARRDSLTLLVMCNLRGEGAFADAVAHWVHNSTSLRRLVLDGVAEPANNAMCAKVLHTASL